MKALLAALALLLAAGSGPATGESTGSVLPPASLPSASPPVLPPPATPAALHVLLTREAQRTPPAPVNGEVRAHLLQLLRAPRSEALRPDKTFARLRELLPDRHGSAQEAYAEALADFLLDPTLPCRQPILGRYFRQRYASAVPAPACTAPVPFMVPSREGEPRLIHIDPERVRAIHLLYAGKNRALASRFGHVSLRLVICPTARSTDAECALNVEQHLVLGYRAHVDELSLSLRKAVLGGYAAHFYANAFLDVYQEYAIDEFRTVYALPLQLTPARRQAMVRELAELHFRAAGPYRYMTRNCATLLQDSLRVLWPEFASDPSARWLYLRPDSFFGAMKKLRLADSSALADLGHAERDGYLFPSTRPYYERAARVVVAALEKPGFSDLDAFLQIDPRARRQQRLADPAFMATLGTEASVREAQIILEEYAMMKSERLLLAALANYLAERDIPRLIENARRHIRSADMDIFDECVVKPISSRARPLHSPTGIPTPEQATLPLPATQCHSPQAAAALREAIEALFGRQAGDAGEAIRQLANYHVNSLANVQELLDLHGRPQADMHDRQR